MINPGSLTHGYLLDGDAGKYGLYKKNLAPNYDRLDLEDKTRNSFSG